MKPKEKKLQSVDGILRDLGDGTVLVRAQSEASCWGERLRPLVSLTKLNNIYWVSRHSYKYQDKLHLELPIEFLK